MNKAQLVDVVQKELGKEFSKAAAERSLDAVLRSIRRGVQTGGQVQIVHDGRGHAKLIDATVVQGERYCARFSVLPLGDFGLLNLSGGAARKTYQ